jgi:hypothetical protein
MAAVLRLSSNASDSSARQTDRCNWLAIVQFWVRTDSIEHASRRRWVGSNQVITTRNFGGGAELWDGTAPATDTEGEIEPRMLAHGLTSTRRPAPATALRQTASDGWSADDASSPAA